ncbi:MAG TPA: tyrosine-type recombinase/integrase [Acidimicrobiales bacterium]|nr:tyrosine-type recombinase/integrase [Acidimicrobiales bacterium]
MRISNWRRKAWQPAADELGFPSWATPYVLRHTAASLMAQRGVPVSAAAAALGHDPAIFLRTYAHLYPGDLRAVADAMDGARRDARDAARVVDRDRSDSWTRGDFAGTDGGASESSGDRTL